MRAEGLAEASTDHALAEGWRRLAKTYRWIAQQRASLDLPDLGTRYIVGLVRGGSIPFRSSHPFNGCAHCRGFALNPSSGFAH